MSKYYTPPATVVDGDIAYAVDVNSINTEADTGFTLAYADISAMEGTVSAWATLAQKWAENPEDTEVTLGAYSAMHWALKSESFVSDAQAYSIDSQNYSIAAAASASTATTKATSATTSATLATNKATAAATSATSAATSATASEASAVRAESAAVDNASDITDLTAVVSTNTGNISDNTYDISLHETRILANASDIASHNTRILANASDINTLQESASEKVLLWSGVAAHDSTIDWTTTGRKLSEFDMVIASQAMYDGTVRSYSTDNDHMYISGIPDYAVTGLNYINFSALLGSSTFTYYVRLLNLTHYSAKANFSISDGSYTPRFRFIGLWGVKI